MALTTEQVEIVRSTVPILQNHGTDITTVFYKNLLEDAPELNNVFNRTNQINGSQARALAQSVLAYATHISDLGVLSPTIERICQKHASLNIVPEQYQVVGKYLLAAMGQVLGEGLTPAVLDAWTAAYGQLAAVFINREAELYEDAKAWTGYRDFSIKDKVREAEGITSFYLAPVDGKALPPYLPGQYISLQLNVPKLGFLQSRQYSLSSAPDAGHYRISIKRDTSKIPQPDGFSEPGLVSNLMHDTKNIGDVVALSYPRGEFYLDPARATEGPKVLISVGVGLTPLLSMFESMQSAASPPPISWIHGTRSTKEQAFASRIRELKSRHDNVTTTLFKSQVVEGDVEGQDYDFDVRMDLNRVDRARLFLEDEAASYYICGPEAFMGEIREFLRGQGVSDERIELELFGTGGVQS